MLRKITKLIPDKARRKIRSSLIYYNVKVLNSKIISFSQAGEDYNIRNIFREMKNGFYVDVGAFHPYILSNTNYLYLFDNWRGINIDASPGSMDAFRRFRKRDINLEVAISSTEQELTFYVVDDISSVNTFSKEFLIQNNLSLKIKKEIKIRCFTLEEILDIHLPKDQSIDLLNIDAEGMDLDILKSNNWEKYRPKTIISEIECAEIPNIFSSKVGEYLNRMNYQPQAVTYLDRHLRNVIYIDSDWLERQ